MRIKRGSSSPGEQRKILILGGDSYVGRHLRARLSSQRVIATWYVTPVGNAEYFDALSMSLPEAIRNHADISHAVILFGDTNPETCAQDVKRSHALNVDSIKRVIDYLNYRHIKPIFTSSEFVFDGRRGSYIESDPVNPVLIYGKQKAEIEKYIQDTCDDYIIVRLAKVFGSQLGDRTIFTNWLDLIDQTNVIKCAADQIFSPVYINTVVDAINRLIENNCKGVFHVCTRKPFARIELLEMLLSHVNTHVLRKIKVIPCSIHDFPLIEKRPLNVSMIPDKLIEATGIRPGNVEDICETIVKSKFGKVKV